MEKIALGRAVSDTDIEYFTAWVIKERAAGKLSMFRRLFPKYLYSRVYLFAKSFAFFLKVMNDLLANDFAHGYNRRSNTSSDSNMQNNRGNFKINQNRADIHNGGNQRGGHQCRIQMDMLCNQRQAAADKFR